MPASPSTLRRSPVRRRVVPTLVLMTQGTPSSRATMAPWLRAPPMSMTRPPGNQEERGPRWVGGLADHDLAFFEGFAGVDDHSCAALDDAGADGQSGDLVAGGGGFAFLNGDRGGLSGPRLRKAHAQALLAPIPPAGRHLLGVGRRLAEELVDGEVEDIVGM